jgi:hypothetical protein
LCTAVRTCKVQSPVIAPQQSQDVLHDAGFMCDKTNVLRKTIKETPYISLLINNFSNIKSLPNLTTTTTCGDDLVTDLGRVTPK